MPDPFELSQYVTSFKKLSGYTPKTFQFADFDAIFSQVAEAIRMRQAGVSIGFNIPENAFINIESYDTTTPSALSDSIDRFQDAIKELTEGSLLEEFGKLPNCDVYLGFFHFDDGLPIVGVGNVVPNGLDFTPSPDPASIDNVVDFAIAIGTRVNELIYALNVLSVLHAKMAYRYELDTDCTPASASPSASSSPSPSPSPSPLLGDPSQETPHDRTQGPGEANQRGRSALVLRRN
jgi:hypothetical protein